MMLGLSSTMPPAPPLPRPGSLSERRFEDYEAAMGLKTQGNLSARRDPKGTGVPGGGEGGLGFCEVPSNIGVEGAFSNWGGRPAGPEQSGNPRFDAHGYPMSPGGTSIRPPPGPPPLTPRDGQGLGDGYGERGMGNQSERPEEPAKYIYELPKLGAADIRTSAVACGNWMAQIRQVFMGISPSSATWWMSVERASNQQYQRWLVADPVDRLLLDPSTVIAEFDLQRYQRVESRSVSLLLAAVPQHVRDEAVANRWLTSASLLFRVQCVYQPGGSSERSMLLTQLVGPESAKTLGGGVTVLRRWQQHFHRVRELHASMPDPSLLLKGVDTSTVGLLSQNPLIAFRVNTFRSRLSLDYNPTISSVLQLVRLLQAEFESASLSVEAATPDKRARTAVMQAGGLAGEPKGPPPKSGPMGVVEAQAKVLEGSGEMKGKGKGKAKGREGLVEVGACYNFAGGVGCKYGDACKFKHDKTAARKQKRCMACGKEGHFRSECSLVPPERRSKGEEGAQVPPVPPQKGAPVAKAKVAPQAKGVMEDVTQGEPRNMELQPGGGSSVHSRGLGEVGL